MKDSGVRQERQRVEIQSHYSGPLPQPEDLEKYNSIVPGAAERILSMAEKEMEHRHNTDKKMTNGILATTIFSICCAFLSVILLTGLAFFALYKGYDTVAASIAVGAIAAVAGVFIFFKTKQVTKD